MITREEIFEFVKTLPNANYDFPWEGDFFSAVLRNGKGKWFGLAIKAPDSYFTQNGADIPENREILNVKCPPDLKVFLSSQYKGVLPAYHMNKTHWITVVLQSGVPKEDVFKLLELSYDLATNK